MRPEYPVLEAARQPWLAIRRALSRAEMRELHEPSAGQLMTALQQADLFVYSGHIVKMAEDSSALMLGMDEHGAPSLLADPQAHTTSLDRPLVLLLGCSSGLSDGPLPIAANGLAGRFLAAGAVGVVASLRAVPDSGDWRFLETFVRSVAEGAPAAEAWRQMVLTETQRGNVSPLLDFAYLGS
jgi:CHAT domain-containing protein